jgi:hypothetical protein
MKGKNGVSKGAGIAFSSEEGPQRVAERCRKSAADVDWTVRPQLATQYLGEKGK